jgi:UDPglucose 6-dehydrogenase
MQKNKKVGLIGYGYVGKAFHKLFPEAILYDEPLGVGTRDEINKCGLSIIAVPTNLKDDGTLDCSIVESIIDWVETPLILIKSALQPGTVDRLKKKTGKRITVSVEMIGEGNYFVPEWKYPNPTNPTSHDFLIIGGDDKDASDVAEYLWEKMSPDINIHLLSAIETEICKLFENFWIANKVSVANTLYEICQAYGANYIKVLQAWGADGRVKKTMMRVVTGKRGWKSKCLDKDVVALLTTAKDKNVNAEIIQAVINVNKEHLTK